MKPPALPRGAVGDAAIRRKTGRGLDHWFGVLDTFHPKPQGHKDRARYPHEEHSVPGWHAQGITMAYERARGIRAVNQAGDDSFQVSVSRALPVVEERRAQWKAALDALKSYLTS